MMGSRLNDIFSRGPSYRWALVLFVLLAMSTIVCLPGLYNGMQTSLLLGLSYSALLVAVYRIWSVHLVIWRATLWDLAFLLWLAADILYFPAYHTTLYLIAKSAILALYIIVRTLPGRIVYPMMSRTAIGMVTVLSVYACLQYTGFLGSSSAHFSVSGPYINPTLLAGLLAFLLLFLSGQVILGHRTDTVPYPLYGALIAGLSVFMLLEVRSAWLCYLCGCGYLLFQHGSLRQKVRSAYSPLAVAIGVILCAGLLWSFYQLRTASADGRVLIWKIAGQMIADKPLLGHGAKGFESSYMHYQAGHLDHAAYRSGERLLAGNTVLTYNEPLRIAVEYGLVGLLAYLGLCISLWKGYRPREPIDYILKSMMAALFVYGLFSYPQQQYSLTAWLTLCWALLAGRNAARSGYTVRFPIHTYVKITGSICCLVLLLATVGQHRIYIRIKHVIDGYTGDRGHVIKLLSSSLPHLQGDKYCIGLYARQLYRAGQYGPCIALLERWVPRAPHTDLYILWGDALRETGDVIQAEQHYRYAARMVPSLQLARARLAILFRDQGRYPEALALAREILAEPVKVYGFATYELHRELREEFGIN